MKRKQIMAAILAAAMVTSMAPVSAFAEEPTDALVKEGEEVDIDDDDDASYEEVDMGDIDIDDDVVTGDEPAVTEDEPEEPEEKKDTVVTVPKDSYTFKLGDKYDFGNITIEGSEAEPVITWLNRVGWENGGEPTRPGKYFYNIFVPEDDNYNCAWANIPVTIEKGVSTISIKDKTVTYNGKAQAIDAATVTGSKGKVSYAYYTDKEMTKKVASPTAAGTYYVRAKVAEDDNYGAKSAKAVLTIKKAASKITLSDVTTTWDGSAKKIGAAKVTGSNGKVSYAYYSDKEMTKKVTSTANAGTYYVRAKVAEDANYCGKSTTAVLTVKKAATKVSVGTTAKTFAYADVKAATKSFGIKPAATNSTSAKITCAKVKGSSALTVTSAGTVKVKKGTKKGTYKMIVSVHASATTNHSAKTVEKEITVIVK